MSRALIELVDRASNQAGGERYARLLPYIDFLDRAKFSEYRPTMGANQAEFMTRLDCWLGNVVSDDDKLLLLEFVPEIFFAATGDFAGLYESAVYGPIARWLVDLSGTDLCSGVLDDLVATELGKTWFCPMTDSMVISEFYHLVGVSGVQYRPDWRSLVALGAPAANHGDLEQGILNYIRKARLEYIVLMDDFIGTGSQVAEVVDFVVTFANKHKIPVLILPLICHEEALDALDTMAQPSPLVEVRELLVIRADSCLAPASALAPGSLLDQVRDLVGRYAHGMGSVYGFGTLGLAYVSYSNCPDNTVPLIHREDPPHWRALFPRATR